MTKIEFTKEVMPFKDKLYRLAKRILISADEAEDAVQEVLFKLWKGRDNIGKYRSTEAFAITMTKNYCLDRLKSKQASNMRIVHTNYENPHSVENQLDAKEGVDLVKEIMEELSPNQKMILQLRDVEQFEFSEIADMLNMNETAIRVALSRARKAVREALIKKYNYGIR